MEEEKITDAEIIKETPAEIIEPAVADTLIDVPVEEVPKEETGEISVEEVA